MIQVDKGIPIPESSRRGVAKYPFAKLKVGDSFFVAGATYDQLAGSRAHFQKKLGRKYTIRMVEEGPKKEKGVRVWRTE